MNHNGAGGGGGEILLINTIGGCGGAAKDTHPSLDPIYYLPQTKFAKVMFQSFCSQEGSTWPGTSPAGTISKQVPPPPQDQRQIQPLGRYIAPGQVHPPMQVPHPSAVHAGRYGQQAGSTHPAGMQSCFILFLCSFLKKLCQVIGFWPPSPGNHT